MLLELFDSHQERTKGTTNLKLAPEGLEQAVWAGEHFARKLHGRSVSKVYVNDLDRSLITGKIIAKYVNAPVEINNALYPWHMGMLEGMTIKDSKPIWMRFVEHPDIPVPSKGPYSQYEGEAFNSFKNRWLSFLSRQMRLLKEDPKQIKFFVSHSRNENVTHGWFGAGARPDFEIVSKWMEKKPDPPTSVHRLSYINGEFLFNEYSIMDQSDLAYGLYLIRHGKTSWN